MEVALTIAGSDSGGGAGIQADLKTFQRHGVFGTSALTAITAQNTLGVTEWMAVPRHLVVAQIEAVARDLSPAATKSGMLANREIVTAVAGAINEFKLANYVLDPVMVATSGDPLIEEDAVEAIRSHLLPLAALVTPNSSEAGILSGMKVNTEEDMLKAARSIHDMGARAVLLKGGHVLNDSETVVDMLYDGELTAYSHSRITTTSTHGTGCTLSAAIAAQLAVGAELRNAVALSIDFVHEAIRTAPGLGSGNGPLNHFAGESPTANSRTSR